MLIGNQVKFNFNYIFFIFCTKFLGEPGQCKCATEQSSKTFGDVIYDYKKVNKRYTSEKVLRQANNKTLQT